MIYLQLICNCCQHEWEIKPGDRWDCPNKECDDDLPEEVYFCDARYEPDWIPVSEEPKKEGWYLTYNNIGGYNVSHWDKANGWHVDWDSKKDGIWVTHYRPLPEPPKGEV